MFFASLESASDASAFLRRGVRMEPRSFDWSQYIFFIAFSLRGRGFVHKIFKFTAKPKFDLLDLMHLTETFWSLALLFFLAEAILFQFLVPLLFDFRMIQVGSFFLFSVQKKLRGTLRFQITVEIFAFHV